MPTTGWTPGEIGLLVAAVFTGVVNVIVAWRASAKVSEVSAKADVIKGHVDGTATQSKAEITSLREQNARLEQIIVKLESTAAVLAQSRADVAIVTPITAAVELTPGPKPAILEVTGPEGGPVRTVGVEDVSGTR